ncbi:C-C motif chemokine 28 [Amia ocellicauda]|uniref:C-C motif chemokine 28 n=1 Tax=Amia ocellicauda TaxID=2972642 RepID=UPI0034638815
MNVKAAAVLAVILMMTVFRAEGKISSCCVETASSIPPGLLRKVKRVQIQTDDGLCDIKAVIVHINGKKLCLNPSMKIIQKWLKFENRRKKLWH